MLSAVRTSKDLCVCIRAAPVLTERPMRLAILMDVSDSMKGGRLTAVKKTLVAARGLLRPQDTVSLVTFGSEAVIVTDKLQLDAIGVEHFYTAVDAITTAGMTNMSGGMEAMAALRGTFDTVIILTDGCVNVGITTTAGLRSMALGLTTGPIHSIGYGADHNRELLRDLAMRSRGIYTYISSDEMLPIVMGDIISGLRTQVLTGAILTAPLGWICQEFDADGNRYRVGDVVPGREYWVVFQRVPVGDAPEGMITLKSHEYYGELDTIPISDCHELREQVLRCRVAAAIVSTANLMERGYETQITVSGLIKEIDAMTDDLRLRPLVMRMRAQLAETQEAVNDHSRDAAALARMSAGGAMLSSQRGSGGGFSSPHQLNTSIRLAEEFNGEREG
jgi:hypothetical protein